MCPMKKQVESLPGVVDVEYLPCALCFEESVHGSPMHGSPVPGEVELYALFCKSRAGKRADHPGRVHSVLGRDGVDLAGHGWATLGSECSPGPQQKGSQWGPSGASPSCLCTLYRPHQSPCSLPHWAVSFLEAETCLSQLCCLPWLYLYSDLSFSGSRPSVASWVRVLSRWTKLWFESPALPDLGHFSLFLPNPFGKWG